MKKKKVNPLRRPHTADDTRHKAIVYSMAIMFTVLCDKEHADKEIMGRVWGEVNDLSEEIADGRVCVKDLLTVLRDEYDIDLF